MHTATYMDCGKQTLNKEGMCMEERRRENIISAGIVLISIFSGLLIQLLIYKAFDVRLKDVPIILLAALWIGFSSVTTYIVCDLEL